MLLWILTCMDLFKLEFFPDICPERELLSHMAFLFLAFLRSLHTVHYSGCSSLHSHQQCQSVSQFSRSVVSNSFRPHELQHARAPCPSPIPGVHPNPCPLSQWCHPTTSFSVVPFSCPQSLPASGLFKWVSSSHQVAKVLSFSISPSNEYSGLISFRMDWLDLLVVQGTLKSLLHTTIQNHQFFSSESSDTK